MTQKSATRKRPARRRPAGNVASQMAIAQPAQPNQEALSDGGFTALLEKATREILAVTYWFEPAPQPRPYPVTIRFSGHRSDVQGRPLPGDRFVQDETIENVVPGSGPIALTTRVHDINPGEWVVTASMLGPTLPVREQRKQESTPFAAEHSEPIARFWHKWAPSVGTTEQVRTCLLPFAHVPGIIPGIWGIMVSIGIIVALAFQFLIISAHHLTIGPWWTVSLIAILAGIIGAKGWYIVVYRHEHLINGWCIQGFIAAATAMLAILIAVFHMPAGVFLDVTAPGLLLAMAIGRVGCFFAGCCGGRPTASRFGVWSSDQHVGARRIPTQLLELLLAFSLGLGTLVGVLTYGPANGAFFVGGLAAYTLVRQGILFLRAEPRKTKRGLPITTALATLVLTTAIFWLAR
jgi:Prolipoprotein diacylglyceryltransferase